MGFRGTTFLHLVSAKGASHSSLGHRPPRSGHICGRALKARLSSRNESHFQRCILGTHYFPGALPQAANECCAFGASHIGVGRLNYCSTLVRYSALGIELACLLEMFLSQLGHPQGLEPASEHPMVKRIFRSELVCLFFVSTCFFEFT